MRDAAPTPAALDAFAYAFPKEAVALAPAHPRDSARLLVVDKHDAMDAVFRDIGDYLPPRAVLVLNDTKVIPARLHVRKATGGGVELLCTGRERGAVVALANKRLAPGDVLAGPAGSRWTVLREGEGGWRIRPSCGMRALDAFLLRHGTTPLPPYMKHSPLSESARRREYQSVVARAQGSVAAPTASLHFTKALLARLRRRGVRIVTVTLHVGLGTFAPVTEEHLRTGALHPERFSLTARAATALMAAQREGRPIIAVGTTALRAIESAADERGRIVRRSGTTRIFIREGYRFRCAQGLITNFHVPRSSLLMLVSALIGRERLLALYQGAVERGYRLFSFGDAMLVLPGGDCKRAKKMIACPHE